MTSFLNSIRWQAYLALKWLAMAVCPPFERAMIEHLEDDQAARLGAAMEAD